MPSADSSIDRLAPTRRPSAPVVMYQSWRSLLFLHWEVDPDALRRLIPPHLELDLFEGRALVGLVPFTMRAVRPAWLPALPWLSYFHETNVRTYVHNQGRDPGVWFFSLEAANPIAVHLARRFFHLPYHWATMSLQRDATNAIHYTSRRRVRETPPPTTDIRARPTGTPRPAEPGTLDHFLLERYLLYAFDGSSLYQGQVYHHPYPAQSAEVLGIEENLLAAAGITRGGEHLLAHYSEGVDVEIFPLKRTHVS